MRNDDFQVIDTDVLIVGGGLAGCWAAIGAREEGAQVTLVDKGVVARSGTILYCHDALAPLPEGQQDIWMREMVEHSEFLSDQAFLKILLMEEGDRIRDLISWGVPFERDERGQIVKALGRGHEISEVVLFDGRKMMEVVKRQLVRQNINLVERTMVTDLLTSDGSHPTGGRIVGALGLHGRKGTMVVFQARAVVIATGFISLKLHAAFGDNLTGDGQAMAFRAGASLTGMEFLFCPGFCCIKEGRLIGRSMIQFQTLGAQIVNGKHERFMERYVPQRKERRATFGLLAQAMVKEIMEGRGPIYFDMRHFTDEEMKRARRIIPTTFSMLDDAGIDPARELVECRPIVNHLAGNAHGGIHTEKDGASDVPGLWAGGAAAFFAGCTEPLSGGMVAYCNVFGQRTGRSAGRYAADCEQAKFDWDQVKRLRQELFAPLERDDPMRPVDIYFRLARKMLKPEYSIIKNQASIMDMINEVDASSREDLPRLSAPNIHELIKAQEAKNFLDLLAPMYLASLERKESRLTHYRQDFPFQDYTQWLKWVKITKGPVGQEVGFRPVPVDKNPLKPPERARVASPVII